MRVLGSISLPGVTRSAPRAREFVGRLVGDRLRVDEEVLGDIGVCVSELIANACEHTASGRGGRVAVLLEARCAVVRVTVIDDGGADGKPHVAEPFGEDAAAGCGWWRRCRRRGAWTRWAGARQCGRNSRRWPSRVGTRGGSGGAAGGDRGLGQVFAEVAEVVAEKCGFASCAGLAAEVARHVDEVERRAREGSF
ncbi:ATP-binding protein [Spirillospora sp. CA-255316]